jgi:hypothetical protein
MRTACYAGHQDPMAVHMQVLAQDAGFPAALLASRIRRTAVCDYITRAFGAAIASSGAVHSSFHLATAHLMAFHYLLENL